MRYKINQTVKLNKDLITPNQGYESISKDTKGVIIGYTTTGRYTVAFYNYNGGHNGYIKNNWSNHSCLFIKEDDLDICENIIESFRELNEILEDKI